MAFVIKGNKYNSERMHVMTYIPMNANKKSLKENGISTSSSWSTKNCGGSIKITNEHTSSTPITDTNKTNEQAKKESKKKNIRKN